MKCPKCGYLGFEEVQRCRNCGYDFSLASAPTLPDLSIRLDSATVDRLADLSLESESRGEAQPFDQFEPLLSPPLATATPEPGISTAPEYPLFRTSGRDDAPLITRASPPRPPLAVRRATQDAARPRRVQPAAPMLDLEPGDEAAEAPRVSGEPAPAAGEWRSRESQVDATEPAPLLARLTAFVIDMAVLGAVDVAVVYLTLKICGITVDELNILPKVPLMAFLLVQNGGYLVAFTLGGQTLGKMAAGIKVVPAADDEAIDLGRSILRAAVWLLLAVPAGLGFVTALFSRDRRGLHDHFAGTRVVRAPTG